MSLIRYAALCGVCSAALTGAALAQTSPTTDASSNSVESAAPGERQTAQEIVVQGRIGYRNRSDAPEPVLVYDTEYFQRFEPLTIGDALKRVPSVTFLSDVIESDGARLRGLDPGYTQILINGEKVPGSNADRSFFLDRIPAELVDRVEIVRSNSARRTADAVAGTLNIVLRDALRLEGGYVKGGLTHFDDGEIKPNAGIVYGGDLGPGRILLGANVQGRYNPKIKQSFRYGDSPENAPDYEVEEFDNREDQTDTRDGTDYNANASYAIDAGATKLKVDGFYVKTDRTEKERSFEYEDEEATSGPASEGGDLVSDNANVAEIDQKSYSLGSKLSHAWSAGETSVRVGYSRFQEDRYETEYEIGFEDSEDPLLEGEVTVTDLVDREFSIGLDHSVPVAADTKLVVGAFMQNKDRDTDIRGAGFEDIEVPAGYDQFEDNPTDFAIAFDDPENDEGGLSAIKEKRRDLFALVEGKSGVITWEAGVRYEHTDVTVDDLVSDDRAVNDYAFLLPSASIKVDVTPRDRITASVARTNRRPRFDYINPAYLEEEIGDHDFQGNPNLRPELSWGADIGYERRIGRTGVAGVNLFYRKVKDLVEIGETDEIGENDVAVLSPRNTGDGKAWGIELDLSTSLDMLGLPDTGLFGNFSWLDSKIRDELGTRRFNGQSKYVYNFGFIQNLRALDAAFGATYRKQGPAFDRFVGEEIRTTYGADLEVFVEKRLFNRLTLRAVGSNLLNGSKDEVFNKFDSLGDQLARDFDEYELESEEAGPVFQLVARLAF